MILEDQPSLLVVEQQQQQQQNQPPITPVTPITDQLEDACTMSKGSDNTESLAPSQSIVGSGRSEERQMMRQGTESPRDEKHQSLPVFSLFLPKSKRGSAPVEDGCKFTVVDQMVDVYVDVEEDTYRLEVAVSDEAVKAYPPLPPKRKAVSGSIGRIEAVAAAVIEVIDITDESKEALEEPEEQCDDDNNDAYGDTGDTGTIKENVHGDDDGDDDDDDDDAVRGSGVRRSKRIRNNASTAAVATTDHVCYSVDNHRVTPDSATASSSSSSSSSSRRASRRVNSDARDNNSSGKSSNAKANLFFLTKVGDIAATITITCCLNTLTLLCYLLL